MRRTQAMAATRTGGTRATPRGPTAAFKSHTRAACRLCPARRQCSWLASSATATLQYAWFHTIVHGVTPSWKYTTHTHTHGRFHSCSHGRISLWDPTPLVVRSRVGASRAVNPRCSVFSILPDLRIAIAGLLSGARQGPWKHCQPLGS